MIKLRTISLFVGILSFTPMSFAQVSLLPVTTSAYQNHLNSLKEGYCISYFRDLNNNLLGVAVNGSKLFLNISNKGNFYLSNIYYGSSDHGIEFLGNYQNDSDGLTYRASMNNMKKLSNGNYQLNMQLYSSNLSGNDSLILKQPLAMKETCKAGDFHSVLYQRSNISKIMQFLFFRH